MGNSVLPKYSIRLQHAPDGWHVEQGWMACYVQISGHLHYIALRTGTIVRTYPTNLPGTLHLHAPGFNIHTLPNNQSNSRGRGHSSPLHA